MSIYCIVRIGDPPGNSGSENKGGTFAAWSESENNERTEIIEVDLATGDLLHRFTPVEAGRIAYNFRNPTI